MNNKDISLEKRLRQEIMEQLKKLNSRPKLVPNIYQLIQTKKGYQWVESRIIQMIINDGITVSACIPHIENELA